MNFNRKLIMMKLFSVLVMYNTCTVTSMPITSPSPAPARITSPSTAPPRITSPSTVPPRYVITNQTILSMIDALPFSTNITKFTYPSRVASDDTSAQQVRKRRSSNRIPCKETELFVDVYDNYEIFLEQGKAILLKKEIKLRQVICNKENATCFDCQVTNAGCFEILGQWRYFVDVQFQADGNVKITDKRIEQLGVGCKCQQRST